MSVRKIPGNVYAILRFDEPAYVHVPIEDRVTVTRVVPDLASAKAEVERLNALNASKRCHYVWKTTRLADWLPDATDKDGE
jgi:hypothetical protein